MAFIDGICHTVRLFSVITTILTGPKPNSASPPKSPFSSQSPKLKILGSLHGVDINWFSGKIKCPDV